MPTSIARRAGKWDYASGRPGLYALALANLFPLVGLVFFGWRGESIVLLYFFEAIVIFLITALMLSRVAAAQGRPLVGNYLFRYGLALLMMAMIWFGMFGLRFHFSSFLFDLGIQLSAVAILAGHLFSYLTDFVAKGEFVRLPWKSVEARMLAVYFVLFTVPLALVVFSFLMPPVLVAAVLVIVKTLVALGGYATERAQAMAGSNDQGASDSDPVALCPNCAKPLRTTRAKQCPHCLADWHDTKAT